MQGALSERIRRILDGEGGTPSPLGPYMDGALLGTRFDEAAEAAATATMNAALLQGTIRETNAPLAALLTTDQVVVFTHTTPGALLSLPAGATHATGFITLKDLSTSAAIVVLAHAGETIDGRPFIRTVQPGQVMQLRWTGTQWIIIQNSHGAHGWATYADTEHTDVSPLSVAANTPFLWTVNAGTVIEDYRPDPTAFWDNDRIRPPNRGAAFGLRLDMRVNPDTSNGTVFFKLDIGTDPLGGSSISIVERAQRLARGSADQPVSVGFPIYCYDTFLANGGAIVCEIDRASDVYNKSVTLVRLN